MCILGRGSFFRGPYSYGATKLFVAHGFLNCSHLGQGLRFFFFEAHMVLGRRKVSSPMFTWAAVSFFRHPCCSTCSDLGHGFVFRGPITFFGRPISFIHCSSAALRPTSSGFFWAMLFYLWPFAYQYITYFWGSFHSTNTHPKKAPIDIS